jgi:predicted PurR-regulated permease PerM
LSGLIWATTLTVATWPALIRLERLLWGGRPLAVAAMTLLVALAFVVPFVVAITTLIDAASGATTTSSR